MPIWFIIIGSKLNLSFFIDTIMKNHYDVLGVPADAPNEQIRKVYRKLAQIYHPDTTVLDKSHAHHKFQEISEAYRVLSDPMERSLYNQTLNQASDKRPRREREVSTPFSIKVPPNPSVFSPELDFGFMPLGQKGRKTFKVENLGGMVKTINFTCSEEDTWFKISDVKPFSETNPCPLEVEVTVDTQTLLDGQQYYGSIEVDFDGETTNVSLKLHVTSQSEAEMTQIKDDHDSSHLVKLLQTLTKHTDGIWSVAFSPDGHTLASGAEDKHVWLWEGKNNWQPRGVQFQKLRQWFGLGFSAAVRNVVFSPDGQFLAFSNGEKIFLWEMSSSWKIGELKLAPTHHARSLAFSPDSKFLAVDGNQGEVWLWEVKSRQLLHQLTGHQGGIRGIAFSPNGELLASGGEDSIIRLWSVKNATEIKQLVGHIGKVKSVAFSPDGTILASAGSLYGQKKDTTVRLWDVPTGQEINRLEHAKSVECVIFSPNGFILVSSSVDNIVRFWDVDSGQEINRLENHTKSVSSVAFSPDGHMLATGSWDNTIGLYQVTYK